MYLPDVNMLLAAAWGRHPHHAPASHWLNRVDAQVLLCRVTQMGLLRLLTLRTVMREDVITRAGAWRILDILRRDERVGWLEEPVSVDAVWRALSAREDFSSKLWTDDYLAAVAQASGLTLVTLDRALGERHPSVETLTLGT